uniref:Uncharacterized protein n=1 Tax=Arundo donax TaxID=35708 RepID=A0A0A9FX39_ARUDO
MKQKMQVKGHSAVGLVSGVPPSQKIAQKLLSTLMSRHQCSHLLFPVVMDR